LGLGHIRWAELSGKEFVARLEVPGRRQETDFICWSTQVCQGLFKQQGQGEEPFTLHTVENGGRFECLYLQRVENLHSRHRANSQNWKYAKEVTS